jgi:hypothetical protein
LRQSDGRSLEVGGRVLFGDSVFRINGAWIVIKPVHGWFDASYRTVSRAHAADTVTQRSTSEKSAGYMARV